jgi:hypothetical protein
MDLLRLQDIERRLLRLETAEVVPPTAHYSTTAGQAVANNTFVIVNFDTLISDARACVATGASWAYTAPTAGVYAVLARVTLGSIAWTAGEIMRVDLYVNGALAAAMGRHVFEANVTAIKSLNVSGAITLARADTVDVRVYQNSGASDNLSTSAGYNWVCIGRIG